METGIDSTAPADGNRPLPFRGKLSRAFKSVTTHPAFLASLANAVFSGTTGNRAGAWVQGLTTGGIAVLTARASWRGKEARMSYFLRGTVNIVTAATGLYQGLHVPDLAPGAARKILFGNICNATYGAGHVLSGLKSRANMLLYGLADLSLAWANPQPAVRGLALGIAAVGLLKTVFDARAARPEKAGVLWHATPARIYALGYLVNAAAAGDRGFMISNLLWAASNIPFDPAQNKALRDGVARGAKAAYRAARRAF